MDRGLSHRLIYYLEQTLNDMSLLCQTQSEAELHHHKRDSENDHKLTPVYNTNVPRQNKL